MISELTAQIVSAHVSNNSVSVEQLPALIQNVYRSLAGAHDAAVAREVKPEPSVPIRQSVKPDGIVCLACGQIFQMLKRHLRTDHQLGIVEYRQKYGLPSDYPMVSPNYAKVRSRLAKQIGLGLISKSKSTAVAVRKGSRGHR
jgi:predicted transcriptional regulator